MAKDYNRFEIIGETWMMHLEKHLTKPLNSLGYGYPGGPIIEKLHLEEKSSNFLSYPNH